MQSQCSTSPRSSPDLHALYGALLCRYTWDVFATLTWRASAGPEQVVRDYRTWICRWMGNEAVSRGLARWVPAMDGRHRLRGPWSRSNKHDPVVWVLGVEPHESGRLHAHALIKFPSCFGEVRRAHGQELWWDWHGMAKIVPPRSQEGVSAYVGKYVAKPGSDLVFSDSFRAAAMAGSESTQSGQWAVSVSARISAT